MRVDIYHAACCLRLLVEIDLRIRRGAWIVDDENGERVEFILNDNDRTVLERTITRLVKIANR